MINDLGRQSGIRLASAHMSRQGCICGAHTHLTSEGETITIVAERNILSSSPHFCLDGVCCLSLGLHTQHGAVAAIKLTQLFHPSRSTARFLKARKGQATSELPEWLSAFATQSQIEASRDQAEQSERNITALLAKLDQQEERQKDAAVPPLCSCNLRKRRPLPPLLGHPAPNQAAPHHFTASGAHAQSLSLREFWAWRATWTDFFELSNGQQQNPDRQLALFRACLSSEMRGALGHTIPTKTNLI